MKKLQTVLLMTGLIISQTATKIIHASQTDPVTQGTMLLNQGKQSVSQAIGAAAPILNDYQKIANGTLQKSPTAIALGTSMQEIVTQAQNDIAALTTPEEIHAYKASVMHEFIKTFAIFMPREQLQGHLLSFQNYINSTGDVLIRLTQQIAQGISKSSADIGNTILQHVYSEKQQ